MFFYDFICNGKTKTGTIGICGTVCCVESLEEIGDIFFVYASTAILYAYGNAMISRCNSHMHMTDLCVFYCIPQNITYGMFQKICIAFGIDMFFGLAF